MTSLLFVFILQANFESNRDSILELMKGNTDRVNCIKTIPHFSAEEKKNIEDYTENNNARARETFRNIASNLHRLETYLEVIKAEVKYLELHEKLEQRS